MHSIQTLQRSSHSVFSLHAHIVLCTKYRRKVLDGEAIATLRGVFERLCESAQSQLIEMDGEADHVHLLIQHRPTTTLSVLVRTLKSVSSRMLRQERIDIAQRYRNPVLWSPAFFVASCDGAPIDIVRRYIEQQATPH